MMGLFCVLYFMYYNPSNCFFFASNSSWVMKNEPLKIKKRGEDGSKVITVRIKEDTLAKLDKIANETNYSRNELINIILSHGVDNIEVE